MSNREAAWISGLFLSAPAPAPAPAPASGSDSFLSGETETDAGVEELRSEEQEDRSGDTAAVLFPV